MAILGAFENGYCHATNVNVRNSPVSGSVLYQAQPNEQVQCQGTSTGSDGYVWLYIRNVSNTSRPMGWIRHDFITAGTPGGGTNPGTGSVLQLIQNYSNSASSSDHITRAQYLANLDYYASLRTIAYKSAGTSRDSYGNYTAMCCASYPQVSRAGRGGGGCTTQYNSYMAASNLKGTIASLGGYGALIPGMEIFQGTAGTKEHMGVYMGTYNFGSGYEPAVYQSTSSRTTLKAKYDDSLKQGPNLTSMNNKWLYWGWPKYVKL